MRGRIDREPGASKGPAAARSRPAAALALLVAAAAILLFLLGILSLQRGAPADVTAGPPAAIVAQTGAAGPPPPTGTAVLPSAPSIPLTATALPPAVSDFNALLARLDGGLWTNNLDQAATELDAYLSQYRG